MIVLAFFGGFLVLMVVAAMFHDRRARRRGLRPGVSVHDIPSGSVDIPSGGSGVGGA
jgi:hypothetical protein